MPALMTLAVTLVFLTANACALAGGRVAVEQERSTLRGSLIAHAQVWRATDVARMDLKRGPNAPDGFAFGEVVTCEYLPKSLEGRSPKFACQLEGEDEVKVKFGGANGEVYGEVVATRLMWALGFGADRMYPVKVICRGCPAAFGGTLRQNGESIFDPAVIERKMPGHEMVVGGREGWSWGELDLIDEERGGAPVAQRDALKLLAVLMQHTDNKPQQQRLLCLDPEKPEGPECARPFMMINDVGLTFGRANLFNANARGSVNLAEWSQVSVWHDATRCVGNLPRSMTGTLDYPVISEGGRAFLARLLAQLSDAQLSDLFEVARVELRPRVPTSGRSGFATVDEWVNAFKQKRNEIASRRCA
jgi:hypothetical protein